MQDFEPGRKGVIFLDKEQDRRLLRWELQSAARDLMPGERVCHCLRSVIPGLNLVRVMYSPSVHRAHYKNLVVCGSVWMCPICGGKISERRRVELTRAIDDKDFCTMLVTFTMQHSWEDSLKLLLGDLMNALYFLHRHRLWREFVNDYGLVGSVRSLEVTYGFVNGWHPHSHSLFLFESGQRFSSEIESSMKDMWVSALNHFERSASYARGCDVRTAEKDVADYVAKWNREPLDKKRAKSWTQEHELTKSGSKVSRTREHRTMNQLLLDYCYGDKLAGQLWQEYARVLKGRKQLVWSHGLRKLLGLGIDQSDLEIAKRIEQDAVLLARLTLRDWRIVRDNDCRGELLEVASSGDFAMVQKFLRSIGARGF